MRAHKDCHDTKYELLELWVNEVYRTYFEKLAEMEKPDVYERVSGVMMYYFGEEAKTLLSRCQFNQVYCTCNIQAYNLFQDLIG